MAEVILLRQALTYVLFGHFRFCLCLCAEAVGYLHVQGHVFDVLERGAIQTVHRDVDHSVIIGGNG